ncbi:putative bifunctional diguanylate cyclase/phosphodiesterase [Notoacmeibacter marinus]|uniref:putative bifunctional diguanylate cyclase/phosphodiesterase n=1 Tax=Notoacmeibacter marinus TaxID=1876515 RepID=UPI000DF4988F|nr:EAL domain-containing protein [Notoacmeibacter marinus]
MFARFTSRFLSLLVSDPTANLTDKKTLERIDAERRIRVRENYQFIKVAGAVSAVTVTGVGVFAASSERIWLWALCYLLFLSAVFTERLLRHKIGRYRMNSFEGISTRGTVSLVAASTIWAAVPAIFFPIADGELLLFVCGLACGNMAFNSLFLYMAPRHAAALVLIMAAGCLIGLIGRGSMAAVGVSVMLLLYAYGIIVAIRQISNAYFEGLVKRFELERSRELFRILFRDFEDTSSDWMWSVNEHGELNHISPQFLEDSRTRGYSLEPAAVYRSLKDPAICEKERAHGRMPKALLKALKNRLPFRDIVVAVELDGAWRYWRVSGRPVLDTDHRYIGMRGSFSDITDTYLAEQHLHFLALHDPLTGLANRASFEREVEMLIETVSEANREFALLTIDIDKFKMVNDTLGHQAGDEVLKEIGRRLRTASPDDACIARFGGDEFCVLLPAPTGEGESRGIAMAEGFISSLDEPLSLGPNVLEVDCSVGLAVAPRDGVDRHTIHRNADLALYRSKTLAGSSYRIFAPEMDALAQRAQELEYELRTALKRNEFELNYQPLVDSQTRKITGYEALLRWNNLKFGPVSPGEFVPIAERSGMIAGIGEWVLHQACMDAAGWPNDIHIAVNLSPHQLNGFSLLAVLPRALGESGLLARRLELEITETALEGDPEHIIDMLHSIREMGISIALDDFGTGYSSLSHLVRFPFDKLKIDRSFVSEAMVSAEAMTIVRAIVSLAHNLKVRTTAEGVETEEQFGTLAEMGIDEIQGYLIARPLPADRLDHAQNRFDAAGFNATA